MLHPPAPTELAMGGVHQPFTRELFSHLLIGIAVLYLSIGCVDALLMSQKNK
ncbi:hypothetical protein KKH15_01045 [Patescibacteria group bacterium]|nr:hypothetical protein [Patescibacteria group bacterium]MBU1754734.1 hypothetical protein [Patescibacteria group bacterium]